MTTPENWKAPTQSRPRSVAVLASAADLARALRLRRPPDFFELRLDALFTIQPALDAAIPRLRAPLILTARHPAEGGANALRSSQRAALLSAYLPHAAALDIELRSAEALRAVRKLAAKRGVRIIISIHDFDRAPSFTRLQDWLRRAEKYAPAFTKIAVRTETAADLACLLAFFQREKNRRALSVMGVGQFGQQSRRILAALGSALNYAHLGHAAVRGQLSLVQLRRVLARH